MSTNYCKSLLALRTVLSWCCDKYSDSENANGKFACSDALWKALVVKFGATGHQNKKCDVVRALVRYCFPVDDPLVAAVEKFEGLPAEVRFVYDLSARRRPFEWRTRLRGMCWYCCCRRAWQTVRTFTKLRTKPEFRVWLLGRMCGQLVASQEADGQRGRREAVHVDELFELLRPHFRPCMLRSCYSAVLPVCVNLCPGL